MEFPDWVQVKEKNTGDHQVLGIGGGGEALHKNTLQ